MERRDEYGVEREALDSGALATFDRELSRFDQALEKLNVRIAPILNQYDSKVEVSEPRAEPSTELHARIDRLRLLTDGLQSMTARIEL